MVPICLLLIALAAANTAVASTISITTVESEGRPNSRPMLPSWLDGKPEDQQVRLVTRNCETCCVTLGVAL